MENKSIHSEEYKGYTVKIYHDHDPINPMDDEETFKLFMPHSRYELGNTKETPDNPYISLPIYLYDHGGITINTTGFHCPWDSGQIGVIYINRDEALSIWKDEKAVLSAMDSCIQNYDYYLGGDSYGYVIEFNGDHEHSCWGFLGGYEYCLSEAKSVVDHLEPIPQQPELELNN